MKKFAGVISVLLVIVLIFSSCGIKKNSVAEENTIETTTATDNIQASSETVLRLPYNEADGINPFFARSYENLYLARLLYSSLYAVSSSYEAIPVIANSINVIGNTATVTIQNGLSCHGSADITLSDVVYSFNLAKTSYAYSAALDSIESAEISGNAVKFVSKFADSSVALKLTFPVVKSNTADLQADIPLGHGEYYFYENRLLSSDNTRPAITLAQVNTADTAFNAYKIGNTDIYFNDLSDCNYTRLYGNAVEADINNMIYLGLNGNLGGLNKNIRSAIAVLLNCDDIAEESYQGHALASKVPCNPASSNYKICEQAGILTSGDRDKAVNIIDRCGYTRYAGKALTNGAYVLSFSLIVNADNKYRVAAAYSIADTLNDAGFYIEVKELSFEDYSERISSGNYDMYLGETKLDFSMDLSLFFSEDGALSKGVGKDFVADSYFQMRAGEISYEDFFNSFIEYYPFIPIAFRTGCVFNSDNFNGDFSRFPYDLYYNF